MAIKTYKKGVSTKLSTNFNSTEFDCHGSGCCSSTQVDETLVTYLQKIRDHFGKPITINSGYRCATHNAAVGGASGSRHAKGQAADIVVSGVKPAEVAKYAESIGILGIGLYETNSDGHFVHVDTRTSKSFWYGQAQASRTTFGGTTIQEETSKIDTSKVNDKAADPKVIWDFLKSQGLNDYGVAGLMGNLYAESGLKPTNLQNTFEKKLGMTDAEYTAAVDQKSYTNFVNDSAGYGLAQWTFYSRKQNMLTFHTKKGKSIGDLNTQLEFLVQELTTGYKTSVWEVLKTAKSVLEASNAVLLKFERPADQSAAVQNKRASYGQEYYNQYANKAAATPSKPTQNNQGGTGKMKYNASNKPLVCMQTQSTCYKGTSKMTVKGVLWHSTGANNPTLKRYVQPSDTKPSADTYNKSKWLQVLGTNTNKNDWNHINREAGLNCWIGKLADGTVTTVQTMPWDYKPWGCGSGSRGSCNNGWIQFEICEDNLASKDYFNKVYQEACEITAYLCKMYNLNPKGTVTHCGTTVPVILCHADSHKLGLGSNHGDVLHWFKKHGKTMDDVRNDVAKLMETTSTITPPEKEPEVITQLYRVRKAWADAKSQIGAYSKLSNAKAACDKAGKEYSVFDGKGLVVYPENKVVIKPEESKPVVAKLKVGDAIKLLPGATYTSGKAIPAWVFKSKLYLREIRSNTGSFVFSTQKTGAVTGVVDPKFVVAYDAPVAGSNSSTTAFTPYLVVITADVLNVRLKATTSSAITTQVKKGDVFTIVGKSGDWGKLKSGAGWIHLDYTRKL